MAVGMLIVTHDRIGETLLQTAKRMLGNLPMQVLCLSVGLDADPERLSAESQYLLQQLNDGDGVVVLTDMYGSTPSNIAYRLVDTGNVHVVSGINLPMLIRTLNYAALDLDALTQKALSGGREGIFCSCATATELNDPCLTEK